MMILFHIFECETYFVEIRLLSFAYAVVCGWFRLSLFKVFLCESRVCRFIFLPLIFCSIFFNWLWFRLVFLTEGLIILIGRRVSLLVLVNLFESWDLRLCFLGLSPLLFVLQRRDFSWGICARIRVPSIHQRPFRLLSPVFIVFRCFVFSLALLVPYKFFFGFRLATVSSIEGMEHLLLILLVFQRLSVY